MELLPYQIQGFLKTIIIRDNSNKENLAYILYVRPQRLVSRQLSDSSGESLQDKLNRMKGLIEYKRSPSTNSTDIVDELIFTAVCSRFPNSVCTATHFIYDADLEKSLWPIRNWNSYPISIELYSLLQQNSPVINHPTPNPLEIPLTVVTPTPLRELSNEIDKLIRENPASNELADLSKLYTKYSSLFAPVYPLEVSNLYSISDSIRNSMRTLKDLGKYLPLRLDFNGIIRDLIS